LQLWRHYPKLLSLAKIGAAPPGYREKYLIGRFSCEIVIKLIRSSDRSVFIMTDTLRTDES
jgi:hypothetical protein